MKSVLLAMFMALLVFTSIDSFAGPKNFGQGQPKTVEELPPGQLKKAIKALPPQAQGKALGILKQISFPEADTVNMRVSPDGSILYIDPIPETVGPEAADADVDPSIVFVQHSKPGAPNRVFLDFDGMDITSTGWNHAGKASVIAKPYDPSGNGVAYTQDELNRIYNIWQRIAEDYAPFDVDVTTEEPAIFTNTTGRVLFTEDTDTDGDCLYSCGWGGVAWLNVFGGSTYVSVYSPALVYWDNLGSGTTSYNAEAGSHEFGHNLGLSHDGTSAVTYYTGHGTGLISWSPIMGNGYYNNVTQFSIGEYPDANNQQDDLAVISGKLSYAVDDYPDTESTPLPAGGIINSATDVDWFYIDITEARELVVEVTPSWGNYDYNLHRDTRRGANLDIELSLIEPNGSHLVFNDPEDTKAAFAYDVTPGRYYIGITGKESENYSEYNSVGGYLITEGGPPPPPPPPDNPPPVAVIDRCPADIDGAVYIIKGKTLEVVLEGTGSTDDGNIVQYTWLNSSGGTVSGNSFLRLKLKTGTYTYTLQVTDDGGLSSEVSETIKVQKVTRHNRKQIKALQEKCS